MTAAWGPPYPSKKVSCRPCPLSGNWLLTASPCNRLRGTNVNEVTSQALTDLGRAPTFYDCAVEVARVA